MGLPEQRKETKGPGSPAVQGGAGTSSVMDVLAKAKSASVGPEKAAAPANGGDKKEATVDTKTPVKTTRQKVDDQWIESLVVRANDEFASKIPEGAKIEFNIARSKGRPVSLTPRIILQDGGIQAAGPKNRIGFCTDHKWDGWTDKLGLALDAALSKTPRVKGSSSRTASSRPSRWTGVMAHVREHLTPDAFGTEEIKIKSVGKRLTIYRETEDDDRILKLGLKRDTEESEIIVSSATGEVNEIKTLLIVINEGLQMTEEKDEG